MVTAGTHRHRTDMVDGLLCVSGKGLGGGGGTVNFSRPKKGRGLGSVNAIRLRYAHFLAEGHWHSLGVCKIYKLNMWESCHFLAFSTASSGGSLLLTRSASAQEVGSTISIAVASKRLRAEVFRRDHPRR